jgi:uncharacterized protein YndB with AHSA1/START domain
MNKTKVTIKTLIDADIRKVWDYFTAPEHITKWNFASDDWHCPTASNDLIVGGKLKRRMEAKDGSFGFDFEAIYDEVLKYHKITYTIADGRQATTNFENEDGTTKVTTTFDAEKENSVEMQKKGWQTILDNFKKYVESN